MDVFLAKPAKKKLKANHCHFLATSSAELGWAVPGAVASGRAEQARRSLVSPSAPLLFLCHADSLLNASLADGLKHSLSLKTLSTGSFALRG